MKKQPNQQLKIGILVVMNLSGIQEYIVKFLNNMAVLDRNSSLAHWNFEQTYLNNSLERSVRHLP